MFHQKSLVKWSKVDSIKNHPNRTDKTCNTIHIVAKTLKKLFASIYSIFILTRTKVLTKSKTYFMYVIFKSPILLWLSRKQRITELEAQVLIKFNLKT